jgi:hypothetical protein
MQQPASAGAPGPGESTTRRGPLQGPVDAHVIAPDLDLAAAPLEFVHQVEREGVEIVDQEDLHSALSTA